MPKKKQKKKASKQKRGNRKKFGVAREAVLEKPSIKTARDYMEAGSRKGTKADRDIYER